MVAPEEAVLKGGQKNQKGVTPWEKFFTTGLSYLLKSLSYFLKGKNGARTTSRRT